MLYGSRRRQAADLATRQINPPAHAGGYQFSGVEL
jgi:hypothetical protein